MKYIKLTRGKRALVDDEDFERLNRCKWYCNSDGYAMRDIWNGGNKKHCFMHRILNNTPDGVITDHINQNRLDNRKINLRNSDKRKNMINSKIPKNNSSGFKGTSWSKRRNKWRTYITSNGKQIYLGDFKNKEDSVFARKKAELVYHVI